MKTDTHRSHFTSILIRTAFILLAVLPFLLGSLAAIGYYSTYGRNKLNALLMVGLLFGAVYLTLHIKKAKVREAWIIAGVFLVTVAVRAASLILFNTQPISDYMDAVQAAMTFMDGPARSLETARFPYWGFYRITLTALFQLFSPSVVTAKVFNLVLSGLSAVGIYLLGRKITGERRFGLAAALVYVIDAGSILYVNMPTGEHIFVALFPLAVLLFLALFSQGERSMAMRSGMALALGVVSGLMDMYKPVALILLIAMGITLALTEWLAAKPAQEKKTRGKQIALHLILIAVTLAGFFATKALAFSAIEHYAEIPPNRHGVGWTLRVGLNQASRGRVSAPLAYYMHSQYRDADEDYETVNAQLMEEALALIEGIPAGELLAFVQDKFQFTWQSNQDFLNWATNTQAEGSLYVYDSEAVRLLGDPLNDAFLILSLVLSTLGAGYCALRRRDKGTLVMGLFILGFSLLLLAVEVQQRYRSVLASAIPFFAAYGLYAVRDGISTIRGLLRKKRGHD